MKKWQKVKIKDITDKIVDNRGKTPKNNAECGIPLLEVNALSETKKTPTYEVVRKYVDSETYNNAFRSGHPQKGDILIPTVGTIGNVCIADNRQCCIAQNVIGLRTNKNLCEPEYLYYTLKDKTTQKRLLNLDIGGVQPSIKVPHLLNLEILLPDLFTQQQIASILSSIDDKIELNTQINHNLEEQIRVLFEDFFINSQHCANWKQGTIADLGNVVGGSTPSKAKPEYYTSNGIAWITPKDLSGNKSKFISKGVSDITPAGLQNSSAVIMPRGTVLFSSRAPIGYIAIAKNEITTNQGFKSVVPHPHIGTAFVYCFLKHNLPKIESMASGSTFKEVSGSVMKAIPAVIPAKEVLMNFSTITQPLFDQQELLESENQRLARLRDALLPKLMSGEIDVSEVEV